MIYQSNLNNQISILVTDNNLTNMLSYCNQQINIFVNLLIVVM